VALKDRHEKTPLPAGTALKILGGACRVHLHLLATFLWRLFSAATEGQAAHQAAQAGASRRAAFFTRHNGGAIRFARPCAKTTFFLLFFGTPETAVWLSLPHRMIVRKHKANGEVVDCDAL